jgi:hypothetical protein
MAHAPLQFTHNAPGISHNAHTTQGAAAAVVYKKMLKTFQCYHKHRLTFFAFAIESYRHLKRQPMAYIRHIATAAASTRQVTYRCS